MPLDLQTCLHSLCRPCSRSHRSRSADEVKYDVRLMQRVPYEGVSRMQTSLKRCVTLQPDLCTCRMHSRGTPAPKLRLFLFAGSTAIAWSVADSPSSSRATSCVFDRLERPHPHPHSPPPPARAQYATNAGRQHFADRTHRTSNPHQAPLDHPLQLTRRLSRAQN